MNTSALAIGFFIAIYVVVVVVVRFRKTGIEKKKWSGGTGVISWYWVSLSFSID